MPKAKVDGKDVLGKRRALSNQGSFLLEEGGVIETLRSRVP